MANPTTNYGWPMPTSTDLVTDLPADFALFGQPVDTSLKALNPETTLGDIAYRSATSNTNTRLGIGTAGQVLAVSGGVPAWTTTADVTPLTTKGDLFTFTTVDARIGIGANNTVLTADSAEATGMKWATAAAPTFVGASVYRGASQSIANATATALTFDNETYDTDAFHDNSTNNTRMTVPAGKAGKYLVTGVTYFTNHATGQRIVYIYKNGANVIGTIQQGISASIDCVVQTSFVVSLAVSDYVELFAYQNSGGALNVFGTSSSSGFQVSYLGA